MSAVVVTTSPADAAAEAVKDHHAGLASPLVRWCDSELIPHALAEEQAMDPAVHEDPRAPQALRSLFESHVVKENEQILPRLAQPSRDSLTVILDGIQSLLGGPGHSEYAEAAAECGCGGECGCGHQHPADLDTRWEDPAR